MQKLTKLKKIDTKYKQRIDSEGVRATENFS